MLQKKVARFSVDFGFAYKFRNNAAKDAAFPRARLAADFNFEKRH